MNIYTDSDYAGDAVGRKSTSGGCVCIGKHLVRTWAKHQKVTALSSGEAELYAVVTASCEGLGVQAYGKDLGVELKGNIYMDSSAALGIVQRTGVGRMKHVHTQGLWVQEAHSTGRLGYRKIKGENNPSDILTKHVSRAILSKHLYSLNLRFETGRASLAPKNDS